jgi:hypothetical protein
MARRTLFGDDCCTIEREGYAIGQKQEQKSAKESTYGLSFPYHDSSIAEGLVAPPGT